MAQQATAEMVSPTETVTVEPAPPAEDVEPTLRLHLHRPPNPRHVAWKKDTVDNEHMGKKKSKCCCVYRKPHAFDESSSDEEDECSKCLGHRKPKSPPGGHPPAPAGNEAGPPQ